MVTFIWLFILRPKRKVTLRNSLLLRPGAFTSHATFPFLISAYQENLQYENITRHTRTGGIALPVSRHNLADTAHPTADQHYGLTLNDTPFADERVIEQHIEAGISLCDAVNFLVEKYALVRTDQLGFSAGAPSQLINSIDILRARRATGLMTRNNYRMVNNITQGKHPEAKR